jgi:hypothetical protein
LGFVLVEPTDSNTLFNLCAWAARGFGGDFEAVLEGCVGAFGWVGGVLGYDGYYEGLEGLGWFLTMLGAWRLRFRVCRIVCAQGLVIICLFVPGSIAEYGLLGYKYQW